MNYGDHIKKAFYRSSKLLIKMCIFLIITENVYASDLTEESDVSVYKKFGVDISEHLTFGANGELLARNGKKFDGKIIKYINVESGSNVNHPDNKKINIEVISINKFIEKNVNGFIANIRLKDNFNDKIKTTIIHNYKMFPAKINDCYVSIKSFGIAEDNSSVKLSIVDKKTKFKSFIEISNGEEKYVRGKSKIKITDINQNIEDYMPEYSGKAITILYTSENGEEFKQHIIKNNPEYSSNNNIPVNISIENFQNKSKNFYTLLCYCD